MAKQIDILCSESSLYNAWTIVKAKGAAGGIDGITIQEFEKEKRKQIPLLADELKSGTWKPYPYLEIEIPKSKDQTEKRKLAMIAIRDKIVQQAIRAIIEPRYDRIFVGNSYGYRPGKGATKAIRRVLAECKNKKYKYVLRLDIDNYFDTIDHYILRRRLAATGTDEELIRLIMLCMQMGKVKQKSREWIDTEYGTPQGASTANTILKNSIALGIITGKIKNQLSLVKYFNKYHKNRLPNLQTKFEIVEQEAAAFKLWGKKTSPDNAEFMQKLLGHESQMAIRYWDYIREMISDDEVEFAQREHQGAKDLVNSMLNYGYAILYARAWQALLAAKLNPYDSIIHVRQEGKPTLVYDFVEIFRSQIVDRIVIRLIQKGQDLVIHNGLLTDKTRQLLVKSIMERLARYEKYQGEEMKMEQIIFRQAKLLAKAIDETGKFKPYVGKW